MPGRGSCKHVKRKPFSPPRTATLFTLATGRAPPLAATPSKPAPFDRRHVRVCVGNRETDTQKRASPRAAGKIRAPRVPFAAAPRARAA